MRINFIRFPVPRGFEGWTGSGCCDECDECCHEQIRNHDRSILSCDPPEQRPVPTIVARNSDK
jgi:hypothetical protein